MIKYNTVLDMETINSNSTIIKKIAPNSRVLEVGCAAGHMTRYLKENLSCDVSVVEIDEEAGKIAAEFAISSLLGTEEGDITKHYWLEKFANEKFDYIIFADILEHLLYPEQILKASKSLLKDNGSILISVPNIAYNGVIVELFQERFTRREVGLLDNTHLKFYSMFSLKSMVKECGLVLHCEENIKNAIECSEFKNSYKDIPLPIFTLLKAREYGEVYQFVWELKKKNVDLSICIPVLNKYNFTKSCLTDLFKLDSSKVEIIVYNNGSTDETQHELQNLEEQHNNLLVINSKENRGFGFACNEMFSKSNGSHVMFLNNDIRVKSDHNKWALNVIEHCTDNNIVGPTGGFIDPKNGYHFKYETEDQSKEINYISGWNMTAKRSVWNELTLPKEVGPFDATSFFVFYEDSDLCLYASTKGIDLKIIPNVPVVHFKHQTAKSLNMNKLYQDSRMIFLKKWS